MTKAGKPEITQTTALADQTTVKFWPDLARFGLGAFSECGVMSVFEKRVHDIAACNETLEVRLNGQKIVQTFPTYCAGLSTRPMVAHKQV